MNSRLQLIIFSILISLPLMGYSITLNDVYNSAQSMAGYDKVLILEPNQVYTGGILFMNEKIAIWGNGATIDLQNNSIIAIGKGLLDADGCIFINGTAGLSIADEVRANVSNCVFYHNDTGIQHLSAMAPLVVYNTIFMNQGTNAVYTHDEALIFMEYNVAYNSGGDHFVAGCGT